MSSCLTLRKNVSAMHQHVVHQLEEVVAQQHNQSIKLEDAAEQKIITPNQNEVTQSDEVFKTPTAPPQQKERKKKW